MNCTNDWIIVKDTADKLRVQVFKRLLGQGNGRTLVDLGCGPGAFARHARDGGWKVTAVDGRTFMLPEDPAAMAGIEFVQSDVRDYDPSGFDAILLLGLLYHLPMEEQERLLRACSYTEVLLETQVVMPGPVTPAADPWGEDYFFMRAEGGVYTEWPKPQSRFGGSKSATAALRAAYPRIADRLDLYEGVFYAEKHCIRAENWRSSIGNKRSFWHTERSLMRMLEKTGYRNVRAVEPPVFSTYGTRKFYVLNPKSTDSAFPLDGITLTPREQLIP